MNDRLKDLANQAGLIWQYSLTYQKSIELFAKLVRHDERELNAKLCEEYQFDFARAIREGHRL
jgi:hypothetical protein